MIYFLLILIVGGFLFYFTRKKKPITKDSTLHQEGQEKPVPVGTADRKPEPKPLHSKKDSTVPLYKKKGLKEFNLVGANHYGLDRKEYEYPTSFFGSVKCDLGGRLGVYRDDGKQIAQIAKSNTKLYNSLAQAYNGENILWGHIYFSGHDNKWQGRATIPVGHSQDDMERIRRVLDLKFLNQQEMAKEQKTSTDYLTVLERHRVILEEMKNLNIQLPYEFPVRFISLATKHFEEEKNWSALVEVEKYTDLIDNLSSTYKNATLRRIDLAKSNVQ